MRKITISTLCFLLIPAICFATITFDANGRWEESFNFEWPGYPTSLTTWPANTNGLQSGGGGYCLEGGEDEADFIGPEANNPLGTGISGLRHLYGQDDLSGGGGITIYTDGGQPELWFRYYIRFEYGFKWALSDCLTGYYPYYQKQIYMYTVGSNAAIFGFQGGIGTFGLTPQGAGDNLDYSMQLGSTATWDDVSDPITHEGDNTWHCVEFHVKMDTVTEGVSNFDAELDIWFDGLPVGSKRNGRFTNIANIETTKLGWKYIIIGSNSDCATGEGCKGNDYDDIVIYNTAPPNRDSEDKPFIGPIGYNSPTVQNITLSGVQLE